MSGQDVLEVDDVDTAKVELTSNLARLLQESRATKDLQIIHQSGVVCGELIGMTDDGRTALVLYAGQLGSAAIMARTVIDLHGSHIGKKVVLMLEDGDVSKPIVMGVLRDKHDGESLGEQAGQIELDADGQRMIVSAKEQIVLRCGKASITLTNSGKVLIQGTYVLSKSEGAHRIKGGSVQLN